MATSATTYDLAVANPTAQRFGGEPVGLAPRLEGLERKTIGLLWNGKPNGDVALDVVRERLAETEPTVELRFYAGSQPMPPTLLEEAAAECDAFIAATADCGGCTSWITHDCVQLERMGKPAVIIVSRGFEGDLKASAEAFAMADLQHVIVPLVYNNISEAEARRQTEPVVGSVVQLLLERDESAAARDGSGAARRIRFSAADALSALEDFNTAFVEQDWGDGFPLWPPTAERVEALGEGLDGDPDDVVCLVPPGNGTGTVQLVAANAAMAGCRPEEMPVVAAALRAIGHNDSPMVRLALTSTSAHAPMVVVNGPVARELGINGGQCCMGPGRQNAANIRIGRAVVLCLKNIGRWYPGLMDLDAIGSVRKNVVVIAENEEESPWEPYHVTEGFAADESTVTVFFTSGEWDISIQGNLDPQQLARAIGSFSGGNNSLGYFEMISSERHKPAELGRLLLLSPPHAQPLHDEGGFGKDDFTRLMFDLGHEPIARLREPAWKVYKSGRVRPEWEWVFELSEEEARAQTLPVIPRWEQYKVVVAGSVRGKNMLFPTRVVPFTEPVTPAPGGAR